MLDADAIDDTAADSERFAADVVAQDPCAGRVAMADVDAEAARRLIAGLLDMGVVILAPYEWGLHHAPGGATADSISERAVFHRGWSVVCDVDEGDR